jgi:hypothetical protein
LPTASQRNKATQSLEAYTGNGSTDGTFVYTGFKPAFVMSKRTDSTENWYMKDNKRDIFNPVDNALYANSSAAELTDWGGATTDYLSNGFKLKTTLDGQHIMLLVEHTSTWLLQICYFIFYTDYCTLVPIDFIAVQHYMS